jgi:hypothetical protein
MSMPGFTAQASLGRASGTYLRAMRAIPPGGSIQPALSPYRMCIQGTEIPFPDGIGGIKYYYYCTQWVWVWLPGKH